MRSIVPRLSPATSRACCTVLPGGSWTVTSCPSAVIFTSMCACVAGGELQAVMPSTHTMLSSRIPMMREWYNLISDSTSQAFLNALIIPRDDQNWLSNFVCRKNCYHFFMLRLSLMTGNGHQTICNRDILDINIVDFGAKILVQRSVKLGGKLIQGALRQR